METPRGVSKLSSSPKATILRPQVPTPSFQISTWKVAAEVLCYSEIR